MHRVTGTKSSVKLSVHALRLSDFRSIASVLQNLAVDDIARAVAVWNVHLDVFDATNVGHRHIQLAVREDGRPQVFTLPPVSSSDPGSG